MIDPRPDTNIRLEFSREPRPGIDPGGTFSLPMEDVKGRFVYDNGTVTMRDVGFQFHGAPVQFESGMVRVEDSGRFRLGVTGVWARDFRLDARLRKIMPPVMAKFAQRFDEGQPLSTIKGNLGLSWPGARPARRLQLGPRPGRLQRQHDPGRHPPGAHPGAARPRPGPVRRRRTSTSTAP